MVDDKLKPYRRAFLNRLRDDNRRKKAAAILSRSNPDRRAVKRAKRLIRDAGRDERVASSEMFRKAWEDIGNSVSVFGAELNKATAGMVQTLDRISQAMSAVRIRPMPPGEELIVDGGYDGKGPGFGPIPHYNVAIHVPRQMGKTAAMDRYSPAGIERTYHLGDVRSRGYRIWDIDQFEKSLTDEDRERFEEHARRHADELRRGIEEEVLRGVYHVHLGEAYQPARRGCRHGVWLYGDSCATCACEDEAKETKRSD